jgi:hypothetical protein
MKGALKPSNPSASTKLLATEGKRAKSELGVSAPPANFEELMAEVRGLDSKSSLRVADFKNVVLRLADAFDSFEGVTSRKHHHPPTVDKRDRSEVCERCEKRKAHQVIQT